MSLSSVSLQVHPIQFPLCAGASGFFPLFQLDLIHSIASASLRHTPLALNLLLTSISSSFGTSPPWCPIHSSSPACSLSVCMSPSSCPGGSDSKESTCSEGDLGSIPGLGRSPGGGNGNPLQYSCLENPHEQRNLVGYSGVAKSQMRSKRQSTAQHNMLKNNLKWSVTLFYTYICPSIFNRMLYWFHIWQWHVNTWLALKLYVE